VKGGRKPPEKMSNEKREPKTMCGDAEGPVLGRRNKEALRTMLGAAKKTRSHKGKKEESRREFTLRTLPDLED